jgi:hypothetical protein
MSTNRASCRALTVFSLLATLVLVSLPAQGRTAHRPVAGLHAVAASGENGLARLWSFFVSLWPQGMEKEGMTIDPNGSPNHEGVTIDPNGGLNHEGTSIDPDGRT